MAITITTDEPTVEFRGTTKVRRGSITFDSSYPTNGEALSLSTLGLDRLDYLYIEPPTTHDIYWDGDNTSPLLKVRPNLSGYTDSTGGTAATTLAAGVGKYVLNLGVIDLALITGSADVLTDIVIPHKFKLLSLDARVVTPVTTGSKAATLSLEIGASAVTGGAVALTSANCTPLGAAVAGSAITAANTGAAAGTITLVSSSVTAFVEGSVAVYLTIQNMDTADAFASLLVANDEVANATDLSSITCRFTAMGV